MLRISLYHWLPIADNMLPDIKDAINSNIKGNEKAEIEGDAVVYKAYYSFASEKIHQGSYLFEIRINQRGFSQAFINMQMPQGETPGSLLNHLVPAFRKFIAEFLFIISPMSVRNKFAVLNETIVSFQEFVSEKFSPIIDQQAKSFLEKFNVVAVIMDAEYKKYMIPGAGFEIPNLSIRVNPTDKNTQVYYSLDSNSFVFYSNEFSYDEVLPHDGVIYKYCALFTFEIFMKRVIQILKKTRDHVIPLRRQVVIILQRRTEEHFGMLTQTKKYLTYINIKLPVINKVLNYMDVAEKSLQFTAKKTAFETGKIEKHKTIVVLENDENQDVIPTDIIAKINEHTIRIQNLYDEDVKEIDVLSKELTAVLQGNLLSENVNIADRYLDTTRNMLEITRAGKNRDNALKLLSVILSGNFGITLAEHLGYKGIYTVILGLCIMGIAYIVIELLIQRKSSSFRLVIPINVKTSSKALDELIRKKKIMRAESFGSHRVITWKEKINRDVPRIKFPFSVNFNITIDYEMHGYIHTIILDTEHKQVAFDTKELVLQILEMLDNGKCNLEENGKKDSERSLLAVAFSSLDLPIDEKLTGLNIVFSLPSAELTQILERYEKDDSILSREDIKYLEDIFNNKNEYIKWFYKDENNRITRLLGEKNVELRKQILQSALSQDINLEINDGR